LFVVALLPALGLLGGALQVGPVHLGADPVRTLIHECGIWTLRLLWLTLLITPLRELTGLNDLLRLRRMLGLFAFFYALLHMTAWVWLDQGLDGAVIVSEVVKRPYLALGMTAVLLMVPLAVTSTNAMMRRLRKRWLVLHRLIYVIALLGIWHFWWQVKKDIREPLVYALLLALLLGYRVFKAAAIRRTKARSALATAPGKTAAPAP
jgi:sulfoxide reductase heme-binding subunit YedZ